MNSLRPPRTGALLLAALAFLLLAWPAWAGRGGHLGRIVRLEGYGIVLRAADGREVPASQGLDLFSGDKISAGPQSEIRIIAVDGSLFWLGEESILELGELEASGQGPETTLTINLLAGYLKTAADSFDPSRLTRIQVWTENAVATVSEDAMIVIESLEGTKVIGFNYPAKVYGREHPEQVETVLDNLICLVPPGGSASPARAMRESEQFLINNLFTLASAGSGQGPRKKTAETRPGAIIPSSTTTTTTTTLVQATTTTSAPVITTTTSIPSTTTTTLITTTTTGPSTTTTTTSSSGSTTTTLLIPQ